MVHSVCRTSMSLYRVYQAPGQEPEVIESTQLAKCIHDLGYQEAIPLVHKWFS